MELTKTHTQYQERIPWGPDEDLKLTALVKTLGEAAWDEISSKMNEIYPNLSKNASQCRERWRNYLHPDLGSKEFSEQEQIQFLCLHAVLGNKWTLISAQIPGKSHAFVKNYFYLLMRKLTKKVSNGFSMNNEKMSTLKVIRTYYLLSLILQNYVNAEFIPSFPRKKKVVINLMGNSEGCHKYIDFSEKMVKDYSNQGEDTEIRVEWDKLLKLQKRDKKVVEEYLNKVLIPPKLGNSLHIRGVGTHPEPLQTTVVVKPRVIQDNMNMNMNMKSPGSSGISGTPSSVMCVSPSPKLPPISECAVPPTPTPSLPLSNIIFNPAYQSGILGVLNNHKYIHTPNLPPPTRIANIPSYLTPSPYPPQYVPHPMPTIIRGTPAQYGGCLQLPLPCFLREKYSGDGGVMDMPMLPMKRGGCEQLV